MDLAHGVPFILKEINIMEIKRNILSLTAVVMFGLGAQTQAATTIYTDKSAWESEFSAYSTEDFSAYDGAFVQVFNPTLQNGVSVTSDVGFAGSLYYEGGHWHDELSKDGLAPGNKTTFHFSSGIFGFGGDWDVAHGLPGTGITLTLSLVGGGTEVVSTEIPNDLGGDWTYDFWGFASDVAFTDVLLTTGTQGDLPLKIETYHLDNMVYSAAPVPVPAAVWLFGSGLIGLVGAGAGRKKA